MKWRTLIELARPQEAEDARDPAQTASPMGTLRGAARRALADPRVQGAAADLRGRVQEWRGAARARADEGLERLIEDAHTRRGEAVPGEVSALLAERRRERETRAAGLRARAALLALAETPAQRRVLSHVVRATPWAGGEEGEVRYTALLDRLAPSGTAEDEMEVHRALWTLAERRVLAVSPHGTVSACPLPDPGT